MATPTPRKSSFGAVTVTDTHDHFVFCENCNHMGGCPLEKALRECVRKANAYDRIRPLRLKHIDADGNDDLVASDYDDSD
jgi:hypothetical protein